jgi:hypothetical protein
MFNSKALALLCCLLTGPAWADNLTLLGVGRGNPATYVGPGDVVSGATFWWGLRAYSAAVAASGTQKAINVRNTGTNETCDVLIATSGGLASTVSSCSGASSGTALSTFCSSCAITEWYDQSGATNCTGTACHVVQATAANQGTLTLSCLGSLPCGVVASSGPQFWRTASVINANNAAPHSYYAVVDDTSAGTHIFLNFDGGTRNSFYYASTTSIQVTDTASNIGGAVTNAWHVAIASVVSGTNNSTVNVDGTTVVTGTLTTNTGVDKPTFGNDAGGFDPFNGNLAEGGVWPSSVAASYTSLCHNAFAYWGTPTSC